MVKRLSSYNDALAAIHTARWIQKLCISLEASRLKQDHEFAERIARDIDTCQTFLQTFYANLMKDGMPAGYEPQYKTPFYACISNKRYMFYTEDELLIFICEHLQGVEAREAATAKRNYNTRQKGFRP